MLIVRDIACMSMAALNNQRKAEGCFSVRTIPHEHQENAAVGTFIHKFAYNFVFDLRNIKSTISGTL